MYDPSLKLLVLLFLICSIPVTVLRSCCYASDFGGPLLVLGVVHGCPESRPTADDARCREVDMLEHDGGGTVHCGRSIDRGSW